LNSRNIVIYIGGVLFGFGLALGGMSKPEIVLSFLQLKDFGLVLLMGAATVTTFFAINIVPKLIKKPPMGEEYRPRVRVLSRNSILGAIIFGVGWGLSGLCPGAALSSLGVGNFPVVIGILSMFTGAYVMGRFFG
jgi:uncharacterized membrane protein YedE/YeeE